EAYAHYAKVAAVSEADYSSTGMMISACLALGDEQGAMRAARMTLERVEKVVAQDRSAGGAMAYGVGALALLGQAEQAKEWIVRALMIDADNLLMRYNFACALAVHLKDAEAALEQLTPVLEGGPARLIHAARTDPDLDPVRGDPRFAVMLAKAEARLAKTAG
ncbi:MAG TPA: hypothetical protein VGI30_01210, partial [Caulobacteraceae bacterium]